MNGTRPWKSKELESGLGRDIHHESEAALLDDPAIRTKKNQILGSRLVVQNLDARHTRSSDAGKSPMAAKITVVDRRTQSNFINADESIALDQEADLSQPAKQTPALDNPPPLTDSVNRSNLVALQTVKVSAKEKPEDATQPRAPPAELKEPPYKSDRPKLSQSDIPTIQVSKPAPEEKSDNRGKFSSFASEQLSQLPRPQDKRFVRYSQPKTLHLPVSPTVKPPPPATPEFAGLDRISEPRLASLDSVKDLKPGPTPKIVVSQEELQTPLHLKSHRSNSRRESFETVLSPLRNKMKIKAPSQSASRGLESPGYQVVPAQSRGVEEGSAQSKEGSASADRNKPGLSPTLADKKSDELTPQSKKGILKNKRSSECVDSQSESAGQAGQNGDQSPTSPNIQSLEDTKKREVRFNMIPTVQYVSFYIRKHGLHQSYRDDCCCPCALV